LGAQHAGRDCNGKRRVGTKALASEFPQKLLLVHAVLEGLAAINEDDGDFVVELAAEFRVHVNVDVSPREAAPARKLGEALFDHFTQVASLARIDHDVARLWHAGRF
jgi:hypothetical protein